MLLVQSGIFVTNISFGNNVESFEVRLAGPAVPGNVPRPPRRGRWSPADAPASNQVISRGKEGARRLALGAGSLTCTPVWLDGH